MAKMVSGVTTVVKSGAALNAPGKALTVAPAKTAPAGPTAKPVSKETNGRRMPDAPKKGASPGAVKRFTTLRDKAKSHRGMTGY